MSQPAHHYFVVALISALALASPAFAQNAAPDQYGAEPPPAGEGETVVARGVIEKQGITAYQYGTHVLLDDGAVLFALQSDAVALDAHAGERVTIRGTRVPGYQGGAIEGGPDLLNVTGVDVGSAGEPPADDGAPRSPDPGDPGTGDDGADGAGSSAAAGVLPDTGGTPTPWLLAAATLLFGAVLIRRLVR